MPRVLIVAEYLGSAYGQERVTQHSCQYLTRNGWDLAFICSKTSRPLPQCLQVPGMFALHSHSPRARVRSALRSIRDFVEPLRPDVVHFVDTPDYRILKLLARFPCVSTAHTVSPTCPASHRMIPSGVCPRKSGWACVWHNRTYGCLNFLKSDLRRAHAVYNFIKRRRVLRRHHLMLAPSRFLFEVLQNDGFSADRIRLVPNPVVADVTVPRSAEPLFVAAHRLVPLKGLSFALLALKGIESLPWKLKVCGEGPQRMELENQCRELGLENKVQFLGRLDRDETFTLMAQAWGVIQTNLGPESFGMSAAEASALGTPVFGFDLPALNEIIENGRTGVLVVPRDTAALSEVLRRAVEQPKWVRAMGEAGSERMRRVYSLEAHGHALTEVYGERR